MQKLAPQLTYDLSHAEHDIDAGGERVEMQVDSGQDIGWHISQADTLAAYGILATRFQGG